MRTGEASRSRSARLLRRECPAILPSEPIARLRTEQDAAREENLRGFTKNVNDRRLPQRGKEMHRTRKCLILKTSKSRRARKRRRERTKGVRDQGVRKLDELLRSLEDETSIAEAEKPISLPHRIPIHPQNLLPARHTGDEHDQSAFGEVEIGDEGVHAFHPIGRI